MAKKKKNDKVIKTLQVKLHNLSTYKIAILNRAMRNYTKAHNEMLKTAKDKIDIIAEKYCNDKGEYKADTISPFFSGMIIHKKYGLEPLYDSLKSDVAGNIVSYLELKKENENANFPKIKPNPSNIIRKIKNINYKILNDITLSNEEQHMLELKMKKYIKKLNECKEYRPISFGRYEEKRGCCLLYNKEKNRYYAKLYLLNEDDSKKFFNNNKTKIKNQNENKKHKEKEKQKLYYIPSNKEFNGNISKPQCFILVPLEFGKWHEKWLKKVRKHELKICSFKLTKRNGEFYLEIPIQIDVIKCPECDGFINNKKCIKCGKIFNDEEYNEIKKINTIKPYKPETKMGIDLGIVNIATIKVLYDKNNILFTKRYDGKEYLQAMDNYTMKLSQAQRNGSNHFPQDKKYLEGFLHKVADDIIEIAKEYKSQIYLENLKIDKSKEKILSKKKFKLFNKKAKKKIVERINRWAYGRMIDIITYKCAINKIPEPKLVNPKFTSEKCHKCGHNEVITSKGQRANRESQDIFLCKKCGLEMNADENAAINIACYYDSKTLLKLEKIDELYTVKHKLFNFDIKEKTPKDAFNKWIECLKEYKYEYDNIPRDKKKSGSKLAKQYAILKHLERDNYKDCFEIEL